MANRILSNFSSATKSKLIKSKFSTESSGVVSELKEQHNYRSNKCDNKLKKLVVSSVHKYSQLTSLLSIGDNDNFANFSRQHRCDSVFPVASCHNKILLHGSKVHQPAAPWNPKVHQPAALWNPTTGEIQTLPRSGPRSEFGDIGYGLGFDPKTEGDYKVIRVKNNLFELYSQKTDSWKLFECPAKHVTPTRGPSLFINGSYYWPAWCTILRFDFANEKLSADIPLPCDKISNFILAEFEGSLAVVDYSKPSFGLEIWVWNEESLSWARRGGDFASVPAGARVIIGRLLGLFNNDQLYVQDFKGELVLFDCSKGDFKNLGLKSDPPGLFGAMEVFSYVQSSEEEVKDREHERKMKRYVGTLINSTTFKSKLAPINVNDDSEQKPNNNNNNKQKLLFCHHFEGTLYLSHNSLKIDTNDNSSNVLFNFPTLGAQFIPTASCNSPLLLCCVVSDRRVAATLWNPTTDEVKKLPDPELLSQSYYQEFGSAWYGFGFDPKADEGDYKVIRFISITTAEFLMNIYNTTLRTELYSLKTDSWKDLASPFSCDDLCKQPSLYINGFCYWVASRSLKGYIVSFDFANEKFSSAPHIPPPIPHDDFEKTFLLTQFHGSLAALVYARTDDEEYSSFEPDQNRKPLEKLELWIWNKDDELSWTRESVIHVLDGVEKPLGFFGNDQLYLQGSDGQVMIFDCAKGGELKSLCPSLRSTMENWGESRGRRRDNIFPYVESSFPLNNGRK